MREPGKPHDEGTRDHDRDAPGRTVTAIEIVALSEEDVVRDLLLRFFSSWSAFPGFAALRSGVLASRQAASASAEFS
jgi:hypothetical protein